MAPVFILQTRLSPGARRRIADKRNTVYLSAASSWEITIKYSIGKLPLPEGDASRVEYLEAVIAMNPDNKELLKRLDLLKNPPYEPTLPVEAEGERGVVYARTELDPGSHRLVVSATTVDGVEVGEERSAACVRLQELEVPHV